MCFLPRFGAEEWLGVLKNLLFGQMGLCRNWVLPAPCFELVSEQ